MLNIRLLGFIDRVIWGILLLLIKILLRGEGEIGVFDFFLEI